MNYNIKVEFALSLVVNKPDNHDILSHNEIFYTISADLSFWFVINKYYNCTYQEIDFPNLNYYNQFCFKGALLLFLKYDLPLRKKNLKFFKELADFSSTPIY